MKIAGIARALGVFALYGLAASVIGCAGNKPPPNGCDPPCHDARAGDTCAQTCDGPRAYICLRDPPPDGPLACVKVVPCDPTEHCEPSAPCNSTTCSFTRRLEGAGVYTCTDEVCCKSTPSGGGSGCPASASETNPADWTGVCDDAGVCKAPAGD